MTIESSLESIAESLEIIAGNSAPGKPAAASGSRAPAKGASGSTKTTKPSAGTKGSSKSSEKPPAKDDDDGPKLTDVRKALAGLQKREDAAAAKDLLKEVGGATTLSKLDEDKYRAVIDAAAE